MEGSYSTFNTVKSDTYSSEAGEERTEQITTNKQLLISNQTFVSSDNSYTIIYIITGSMA